MVPCRLDRSAGLFRRSGPRLARRFVCRPPHLADNSVTQNSGVKSNIKPPPPPAAIQLDAGNFDDIALDEGKNVLVSFTAPWVCPFRSVMGHG